MATNFVQKTPFETALAERMPGGGAGTDSAPEIDRDRVVWDVDYRRRMVDELNRFYRSADNRHDGHAAL